MTWKNRKRLAMVRIQLRKTLKYLLHVGFTSKGNEKDIAQETPDFIGGFAVSTVEIFTSDFVDVKKVFFPFCSEPNSRTTEYKPPSAWIRTTPCAFFIPTERRKIHAKANRPG